jgi:hypothetical protein
MFSRSVRCGGYLLGSGDDEEVFEEENNAPDVNRLALMIAVISAFNEKSP